MTLTLNDKSGTRNVITGKDYIRYSRQIMLDAIGEQGQQQLGRSTVLVVGVGGLGCTVAQFLVAAGVGHIILVDGDSIESSNLPRQILFTEADIGKAKVDAAKQRLQEMNSAVHIQTYHQFADDSLLAKLLANIDIVADCTDNLQSRHLLNRQAFKAGIPLAVASAARMEAQAINFDFSDANGRAQGCYQCLVPEGTTFEENCSTIGVLGPLLAIAGGMQALAVIKKLACPPSAFVTHQWQCFDGMNQRWVSLNTQRREGCPICS